MPMRWTAVIALLVSANVTYAAENSARYGDDNLSAALRLSHNVADFELDDDGGSFDTRYSRAAVELWSHELSPLDIGLTGGVGRVSQDGDPVTEGRRFTGQFLGLIGRYRWDIVQNLGLQTRAEWLYHDMDDDDIAFEWFEAYGRLGPYARIGQWRLGGGVTGGFIDGERRRTGETRGISVERPFGGYLNVAFQTGRRGEIQAAVEMGPREAISLRFSSRF